MAMRALIAGSVVALALLTTRRWESTTPNECLRNNLPSTSAGVQMGDPAPTPRRPPALAQAAAMAGSPPSAAPAELVSEAQLMARLRSSKDKGPSATIALARDGNKLFPDSADAPERTSILIHALADTGASSEARGEAERMVNHYPDSDWVREIENFTGAHRHRNLRLNDAGELENY